MCELNILDAATVHTENSENNANIRSKLLIQIEMRV